MKQEKRRSFAWLGYLVVLFIAGYIGYSVYYYLSTAEQIEEFEVCYEDRCIKTFHVHADINFDVCGKNIWLPLEAGPLDGPHTHKERNYIHFHERLPYDPVGGKLLNTTPLQLGVFMDVMKIRFSERCVADRCTGDRCLDGREGAVRMFVNEAPNDEFDRYVWKDGDDILITFK